MFSLFTCYQNSNFKFKNYLLPSAAKSGSRQKAPVSRNSSHMILEMFLSRAPGPLSSHSKRAHFIMKTSGTWGEAQMCTRMFTFKQKKKGRLIFGKPNKTLNIPHSGPNDH